MTSDFSPFEQRPVNDFNPNEKRDVLITFRSPNAKSIVAKGSERFGGVAISIQ